MNNESKTITAKFSGKCTKCGTLVFSGTRCIWERGAGVRHITCPEQTKGQINDPNTNYGMYEQDRVAKRAAQSQSKQVTVTMGVFKKDGRIYVVKPNKDKTRVYAKEIVESPARMTESGAVVDFEAVYRPGVIFSLTEADRMDLADAKDFLTKFSKCIVCGRHLKAAKSVAGAIGPVCAKYFKGSSHVNACADHDSTASKEAVAAADIEDEGQRNEADEMLAEDARKNAQLDMTADQKELLSEIKRMNARSRAWVAEDPKNRWAGILTEDIAYWAKSGIVSVADFDEMERLEAAKEARKASYNYDDVALESHTLRPMSNEERRAKFGPKQ
jgi:hypothetical protein